MEICLLSWPFSGGFEFSAHNISLHSLVQNPQLHSSSMLIGSFCWTNKAQWFQIETAVICCRLADRFLYSIAFAMVATVARLALRVAEIIVRRISINRRKNFSFADI